MNKYIQLGLRVLAVLWKSNTTTPIGEITPPNKGELLRLTRPLTGIFAFVLTDIGFKLLHLSWLIAALYGITFAGITASIMVFNDFTDRKRDLLKGKRMAYDYEKHVHRFWQRINTVTGILLAFSFLLSWRAAFLCGSTWLLGLIYSRVKLAYPWNNLLVALCASTPVLVGMALSGIVSVKTWLVFGIVFSTITVTEIIKDIQDLKGDGGYKDTLATRQGRIMAAMRAVALCYLPVSLAMFYPNRLVQATAVCFGLITFWLGLTFTREQANFSAERAGDAFLAMLLIVLLII